MKLLKQVALVTAVAAASGSAFAMEALTDEALSEKTGQDGLTVTITPSTDGIQIDKLLIHDNDGLATFTNATSVGGFTGANANGNAGDLGGTETAGAISIYTGAKDNTDTATTKGLIIQGGVITATIDTDGGNGSTAAQNNSFLNVGVTMAGQTHIGVGKIGISSSNNPTAAASDALTYKGNAQRGALNTENDILGALSLKLNGTAMNIQLGAQPQGAMILMNSTLTGGLTLEDLEVIDANGANTAGTDKGGLFVDQITLTDATGADLTLNQSINISGTDGLVIKMTDPTGGMYAYMKDVGFSDGDGAINAGQVIGDVEIVGLTTGGSTIAINGH